MYQILKFSNHINSVIVFVPNLILSVKKLSLTFTTFIALLGQFVAQTPHSF